MVPRHILCRAPSPVSSDLRAPFRPSRWDGSGGWTDLLRQNEGLMDEGRNFPVPRRINRREALKLAFVGGVATTLQACGSRPFHGDGSGRVPRFEATLPILLCLNPHVRTSMGTTT